MATFKERLPELKSQWQDMDKAFQRHCDDIYIEWVSEFQMENRLTDKQMETLEAVAYKEERK